MTELSDLERPSAAIRVLISNLSEQTANHVVFLIQEQPDMVLIGYAQSKVDVLLAAKNADVLIFGAPQVHPAPGICSHLLSEYPELRIIVTTPNGERSMLYWRGLRRRKFDARSLKTLVTNIRYSYQLNSTI